MHKDGGEKVAPIELTLEDLIELQEETLRLPTFTEEAENRKDWTEVRVPLSEGGDALFPAEFFATAPPARLPRILRRKRPPGSSSSSKS